MQHAPVLWPTQYCSRHLCADTSEARAGRTNKIDIQRLGYELLCLWLHPCCIVSDISASEIGTHEEGVTLIVLVHWQHAALQGLAALVRV